MDDARDDALLHRMHDLAAPGRHVNERRLARRLQRRRDLADGELLAILELWDARLR